MINTAMLLSVQEITLNISMNAYKNHAAIKFIVL